MRQDRRHTRSYIVASDQGGMAHADSGDVGDRVVFAGGQNADDDAQVAGARTGRLSSRLAHCFNGEKQKATAEEQMRAGWARQLSSFDLHRFYFVFQGGIPLKIPTAGSEQNQSMRRQIESYISSVGFHITAPAQSSSWPSPTRRRANGQWRMVNV